MKPNIEINGNELNPDDLKFSTIYSRKQGERVRGQEEGNREKTTCDCERIR